jgi:NAD(P)-dependent dehydrogenase (short-subunit alcohol dehydrogenase family)
MDLRGTVSLITGAKRIGQTVAEEIARRGGDVAICYARSAVEAKEAAARVEANGRRAVIVQGDLSDPAACLEVVKRSVAGLGRLDVLINMASVYKKTAFDDLRVEQWNAPIAVDLRASFLCAQAAAPEMRRQGGGRIVNFSDWTARSGRPRYTGYVPYYVAKAGVIALTEALALELAPDNILVNAVAPGPILAPSDVSEEEVEAVAAATPLKHWGGEIEIAKVVLALLESDFITGETIRVDGGRHIR